MTKAFIPDMIERKSGHIVTIASCASMYPNYKNIVYTATKHGVNGFTLGLNEFLRIKKLNDFVKVSSIMPTYMNTRKEINDYMCPG